MTKKRLFSIAAVAALLMTLTPYSFAADINDPSFYKVDSSGTVTEFTGENGFALPASVGGIAVKKISENLCKGRQDIWLVDTSNASTIGDYAFSNSSIETLTIGKSVKQIGMYAFSDCSKLNLVYFLSENCAIGAAGFRNTGNITFYLPCTSSNIQATITEISDAKGDNNFTYERFHKYVVTDKNDVDAAGNPVMYCSECGEKNPDTANGGENNDGDIDGSGGYNEALPFSDVDFNAWYHDYVKVAYECGIINGKSSTKFDPNANMTLAEAAKIAALVHKTQKGEDSVITQTGPNWYTAYVNYCYDNDILEDFVKFDWSKPATRAEMAYIFARADISDYVPNPDVPLTDIPDIHDITPYAYEILDLYRKGIAAGSDSNYTFHPDNRIKRSEVSALVSRMIITDMRIDLPKG